MSKYMQFFRFQRVGTTMELIRVGAVFIILIIIIQQLYSIGEMF